MNTHFTKPIFITCLIAVTFLSNCIRKAEFEGYAEPDEFDVGGRTPIINSTITLADAIDSLIVGTGLVKAIDNSYYFTYQDSVMSDDAETLLSFDPITFSQTESIPGLPAPFPIPLPKDTSISYNYDFSFENISFSDDVDILYLMLKKGTIDLSVSTTLNQNIDYTVTLNAFIDTITGKPLVIHNTITGKGVLSKTNTIDLKTYKLILGNAGIPSTTLKASAVIIITSSGLNMSNSNQDLSFDFSIKDIKFKRLVGKIKSLSFPAKSQTTAINAFNNDLINKIKFADPSVKFTFENSLGVPIKVDLGQIEALNGSNSTALTYSPSAKDSLPQFTIGYPDTLNFGKSVKSSVTINKSNCPNLIDFLYSSPDHLKYSISGDIGSNDPKQYHFINDNSKVKVKYELKVPIYGQIEKMSMTKKIPYTFVKNLNLDTLIFGTKITNNIPINVKVQMYFTTDDTTNILDSLFLPLTPNSSNIIEAGVDNNDDGKTDIPTVKKTFITRNDAWYKKLEPLCKNMLLVATFYTPEGKNVKFISTDGIKVEVNWAAKGKYITIKE